MNKNYKLKSKIIAKFGRQADFANILNVDEAVISRIVCGRRKLNDSSKKIWAQLLNCNIKDIF